jgi:uracil-DNA glycosylase
MPEQAVMSPERPATTLDPPSKDRVEALAAYHAAEVVDCTRCRLAQGRTQVVVGDGHPDADLMFVGEAPGYHEDRRGIPFVGQAGQLLSTLLAEVGLRREDVYIANVLKCRPPGNRDPQPEEIAACEPHLFRQVSLIRPKVVCTLGKFATTLLSGRPVRMAQVHGCELPLTIGDLPVLLYPLYHPAAALYARAMLGTLQADFARIPELLSGAAPPAPDPVARVPETAPVPVPGRAGTPEEAEPEQLGLF